MGIYEFDVYRVGFEDVGSGVSTQGIRGGFGQERVCDFIRTSRGCKTSSYSHSAHMSYSLNSLQRVI